MSPALAYQEIVELIATANPAGVAAFRPSDEARARVAELIDKEKTRDLNRDEQSELEQYLQLEHVMRLAKARARQLLDEQDAHPG